MAEQTTNIERLSPDKLVANFSQSNLGLWFGAALAIHVVVIGAMSMGYIRDTWIDPEGAADRKAAAAAAAEAAKPPEPAPVQPTPADSTAATTAPGTGQSPIEKAINATATPDEIPATPDDLGIGLDETNPN